MLKIFDLTMSEQWDRVVRLFRDYDTYWLSGYVKAFQIHGDGEPLLFYYENGETHGINVVMKRDIAKDERYTGIIPENELFDFATPYGYGGWIIEGEQSEQLFEEYNHWCYKNGIISEFVRFHPVIANHVFSQDAYEVIPLGNTVTIDTSSPEMIWANMTSKNRNMIRKAQKNGVKIYNGRYPEIFGVFREIYNGTMDKDNAEAYYYFEPEFYQSICDDLAQNVQVFYAVYNERIIAASIMLIANEKINYHLSCSVQEYSSLAATNLLLYKAALWGYEIGCKTLYLGGGVGSGEDSLYKFKKAFYRLDDVKRFYIGKKIVNQEKYNELLEMRGETKSKYFPQYRA